MANTLYDNARKLFLEEGIHWVDDPVKVLLVNTSLYTFSAAHTVLNDVPESTRVPGTEGVLGKPLGDSTTRTTTGGAADGPDVTFVSVPAGTGPVGAIVLYIDTGNPATSPLVAYMDTATGLPITPNGGDIIITWDNGVNKIFRL